MRAGEEWRLEVGAWSAAVYGLDEEARAGLGELMESLRDAGIRSGGTDPCSYLAVAVGEVPAQASVPPDLPADLVTQADRFHWLLRHAHRAHLKAAGGSHSGGSVFSFSWPPVGTPEERQAPVRFHGMVVAPGADFGTSFFALLLFLVGSWHVHRGGLLLHSSVVRRGGDALLFLGESEAGKSTVARLASQAGLESLGDDMNVLVRTQGGFAAAACPTPRIPPQGYGQGVARLRAAFVLQKASENWLEPLGFQESVKALHEAFLQVGPCRVLSKPSRATAFLTACDVARAVPCFRLGFRPDPSFLDLVTPHLP